MNTENTITVLNKFLAIHNERFENYETNILETNDHDLMLLFSEFQNKCQSSKEELIEEIKQLDGTPIPDTIVSKKLLHLWLDIKNIFRNTNREDLLNICEYNEYVKIKTFRSILGKNIQYLNFKQTQILKKHLRILEKNHDHLKFLSDALLTRDKVYLKNHQSVISKSA